MGTWTDFYRDFDFAAWPEKEGHRAPQKAGVLFPNDAEKIEPCKFRGLLAGGIKIASNPVQQKGAAASRTHHLQLG